MNQKYSAYALHHLKEAKHTADINISPSSTTESRQFNCPVSGEESRLINELEITRIEYLVGCQKRREPLSYDPVSPKFYNADRDKEVAEAFAQYVRETGKEPSEFQSLLRIKVPDESQRLFQPTQPPPSDYGLSKIG